MCGARGNPYHRDNAEYLFSFLQSRNPMCGARGNPYHRDNAEYLFSFLQSRNLFLSQTCVDLPPSQRISYKEVTCQDPLLQEPNVEDWTTLDYVLAPLGVKPELKAQCFNKPSTLDTSRWWCSYALASPRKLVVFSSYLTSAITVKHTEMAALAPIIA